MAFKYRNLKTKEIITTTNKVHGKNWELVEDEVKLPPEGEIPEDSFEEDPAEEETIEEKSAEEAPAAAPKSRRGKK